MQPYPTARLLIATLAFTSAGYLLGAPATATGSYSCCGDSNCTILSANNACPTSSVQCPAQTYTNCCTHACNQ